MARLRSKLKVCYQQELNANPDASGELGRWTLSIDAQGAVKSVKLECSPFSTRMNACVEAAMKSVSFDPGDARQVSAGSCP